METTDKKVRHYDRIEKLTIVAIAAAIMTAAFVELSHYVKPATDELQTIKNQIKNIEI